VILTLLGIVKAYDYLSSREGSEESQCKNSSKVSFIYSHFLFPLVVFNFLFAFLSFSVNSLRPASLQGTFGEALNSLSWLLLLLSSGLVFS